MRIVQTNNVVNVTGFPRRLERGPVIRHVNVHYQHVKEPVIVSRPKIEDLNNLVVVHDLVEQYG